MTHKIFFANGFLINGTLQKTVVPQLVEVVHPTCGESPTERVRLVNGESPTEGGHLASGGFR